ncbi:MAG: SpoIIE family protein phosphatase, partial [Acidobacteriota bacterium]
SGVEYRALEARLEPGERLVLLSDGLPEADLPDGDPLGYERFESLLRGAPAAADPGDWLDGLLAGVAAETAPQQRDDWTAVVLQRHEAPGDTGGGAA